jgi:hypothetical protein
MRFECFSLFSVRLSIGCFSRHLWIVSIDPIYVLVDRFTSRKFLRFRFSFITSVACLVWVLCTFLTTFSFLHRVIWPKSLFSWFFLQVLQWLLSIFQSVCFSQSMRLAFLTQIVLPCSTMLISLFHAISLTRFSRFTTFTRFRWNHSYHFLHSFSHVILSPVYARIPHISIPTYIANQGLLFRAETWILLLYFKDDYRWHRVYLKLQTSFLLFPWASH